MESQFHFFVQEAFQDSNIVLEISDKDGSIIQSFQTRAKDRKDKLTISGTGNQHVWNLRYNGFVEFPGLVLYSSPNLGPKVVPGTYTAKLKLDKVISEQDFEIVKDPRLPNTHQDFVQQRDFLLGVRDKVSEAHQAIIDIRKIKDDLDYVEKKILDNQGKSELIDDLSELKTSLEVIENNIHQTKNRSRQDALNYGIRINNRLAFLLADQQRGDFPPTDQAVEFKQEIIAELDDQLSKLNNLIEKDVADLARKISDEGISILQIPQKRSKP